MRQAFAALLILMLAASACSLLGKKAEPEATSPVPPPAVCGNGVIELNEQCDDGNKAGGDDCSPTCQLEPCGNGVMEYGEQCDDGNHKGGDGCDSKCQVEPECVRDADCKPEGACAVGRCVNGACTETLLSNCCGNRLCEPGENQCNCVADCTAGCEGAAWAYSAGGAQVPAKYFSYGCNANQCVQQYTMSRVDTNQEYHMLFTDKGLEFRLVVNYNEPFEVSKSSVDIEIELRNYQPSTLELPVNISEVRVMDQRTVIGRKPGLGWSFAALGDTNSVKIPITYAMTKGEELKSLVIEFDYEVTELVPQQQCDAMGACQMVTVRVPLRTFISQGLQNMLYFTDPRFHNTKG